MKRSLSTLAAGALAAALAGCSPAPAPETEVPPLGALYAKAVEIEPDTPASEIPPPLTCVVGMIRYGLITEWRWTAPTSGGPVAGYEAEFHWTEPDTTALFVFSGKDSVVCRVRAYNSAGTSGPWSEWSETVRTGIEAPPVGNP